MPELWEHCNNRSLAVLIQLYWEEHGCYPEFYYVMKGELPSKPDIIDAPLYAEEEEMEIDHIMRQPPSQQRRVE